MSGHHSHGGHGHDHDGHDEHNHSHDLTPALQSNLYQQIDFEAVNTLNEAEPKSGAAILKKTWAQRLDDEPELESDADEQLLMHIPYAQTMTRKYSPRLAEVYPQFHRANQATCNPHSDLELS